MRGAVRKAVTENSKPVLTPHNSPGATVETRRSGGRVAADAKARRFVLDWSMFLPRARGEERASPPMDHTERSLIYHNCGEDILVMARAEAESVSQRSPLALRPDEASRPASDENRPPPAPTHPSKEDDDEEEEKKKERIRWDGILCTKMRSFEFDQGQVGWFMGIATDVMKERQRDGLPEPMECVPLVLRVQERLRASAYVVGDRPLMCLIVDFARAGAWGGRCVPTRHEVEIRDKYPDELGELIQTWIMVSHYYAGNASDAERRMYGTTSAR